MPYGYSPLKTERFGGLNTLLDPTNLPSFASPDCQNIEFFPGLVRSRAGLVSQFAAIGGNPTINYLKTFVTQNSAIRALALDSLGNFYKENPFGTLANVATIEQPGAYGNSVSQFGREYLALGDGQFGSAIPRQFDDVNFDRVSQVGPGIAPAVISENVSYNISASPNGAIMLPTSAVNSLSQVGFTVTCKQGRQFDFVTTAMKVGDTVQISGATNAGYNGTFAITSVIDGFTFTYLATTSGLPLEAPSTAICQFAYALISFPAITPQNNITLGMSVVVAGVTVGGYNGTWQVREGSARYFGTGATVNISPTLALAGSGSGTIAPAGNLVAGIHKISVMFVTRSGYITAPSPSAAFTAVVGKRLLISNIPIGPPNVVQRILVFTAAGGLSFFYSTGDPSISSSNMVINDNTSTSAVIDFSDTILLEGINVDSFFNLVELGECSGVVAYNSRLFWWGERNKINSNGGNGFNNLTFDGGSVVGQNIPCGWSLDVTNGAGSVVTAGGVFGSVYIISGNSVAAIRGLITQPASVDFYGNPIISPNTAYSVRARIARNGGPVTGTIHVNLFSSSASINTVGITLTFSQLTTSFVEYTASLTDTPLASIPSDLVLRVYVDGNPSTGTSFLIDCIEIYPTLQPINLTTIRCSKAEDPETYDGVTGILQPAPVNGQNVRCCYVLRNLLRIVKDSSLFVTADDGTNEPDQWEIQEVSNKVGTLSARGVGVGDEWAVVAGRSGAWLDDGGSFTDDKKLSREIQPTWDSINWNLGYLIDVKVDTQRKRIYIAVPLGASATKNNTVLMMDYTEGFGDPTPSNMMSIAGLGRKWSIWTIGCNSMNLILRSDNTYQMWFGNNAGTGKIYQLDPTRTVFADDGVAFDAHFQTGYFQMPEVARMNWGWIIANVIGSGACLLNVKKGDQGWFFPLRSWTLSSLGFRNMERAMNVETERLSVRFGTNGIADNFSLQGFSLWAKESTYAPFRGVNS